VYPVILDIAGSETSVAQDDRFVEEGCSADGAGIADVEGGSERGVCT
jgi:hypothetical protein